jgi:acyl-CoA dehydrogenase
MDHFIPDEFREIQELTRRFVEQELRPHEATVDREGVLPLELRRSLCKRAVEVGLFAFNLPRSAGGPGLPRLAQVLIREELGKVGMALSDTVARPPFALTYCDDAQRARFLEPVLSADKHWAFALTEPQAGSDVSAMRMRAIPDGDRYRLSGTKHFISHGDTADFIIVFAKVPEGHGAAGMTALLVERNTPGFSVGRTHPKMGWRGYPLVELVFDDAVVPAANRLGAVGQGLQVAMSNINDARMGVAAHCVGMAQRALDCAVEHARNRVAFGRPIGQLQGLQWMLAEMALAVEQSRALLYAVARTMELPGDPRAAVSMAKLSATEMAGRVADQAVQILGGAGYVAESPVEMIYRDVRAFRIGEGTSEIQKNQIARALLGKEFRA